MAVDLATSVVDLSPDVERLEVKIYRGSGWSVALAVTDADGVGIDLTGAVAHLYFNYGATDQVDWVAVTVGSQFQFDKNAAAVSALTFTTAEVRLVVVNGANSALWGLGQARVI